MYNNDDEEHGDNSSSDHTDTVDADQNWTNTIHPVRDDGGPMCSICLEEFDNGGIVRDLPVRSLLTTYCVYVFEVKW